ncbi:hypothetical protein FRX31_018941, partial [Thalictrum thalictroides]
MEEGCAWKIPNKKVFLLKMGENIFIFVWSLHHCPNHWIDANSILKSGPLDGPNSNEVNQKFKF